MDRKKLITLIILGVTATLLIMYFLIINIKSPEANNDLELSFANNYISYVIEDNETMLFNIFGALNVKKHDASILESINFLELDNSNIEIVNFEIDSGIVHQDYQLLNFLVELKVLSEDLESSTEIIINYNNNQKQYFNIGNITLINEDNSQISIAPKDLEPKGDYVVGYPYPSLDVELHNKSENDLQIHEIYDLNNILSHNFESQTLILANESNKIIIPEFKNNNIEKNEIDFYTITPILKYSIKDSNLFYNMPGVIYGILISDEEKIERVINKSQ